MMRRLLALLLGFLFITVSLTAQSIQWGPEIPVRAKNIYEKTVVLPNQDFLVVQQFKNTWKQRWDVALIKLNAEKMSVRREVEVPMAYERFSLNYKDLYSINDRLILFTTFHNKIKKRNFLFAQYLNEKTLKPGALINIAEAESTASRAADFAIKFSPDSSKIAVIAYVGSGKEEAKLKLTMLDSNINYLYQKDLILNESVGSGSLSQIEVSNRGEIFLVIQKILGRSDFDKSDLSQYGVVRINALGYVDGKLSPDTQFKNISNLKIQLSDTLLLLGGLISEIGGKSAKGFLYERYNLNDWTKTFSSEQLFDFETLTSQLSEKGFRKAERAYEEVGMKGLPEIKNLKLKDFILRSDLGLVFIAEQSHNYIEYDRSSPFYFDPFFGYRYDPFASSSNQTFYHHIRNDIFVVNSNQYGEVDWITRIPKLQHTINDRAYFSSFNHSITRDQLLFLFNDHPNNEFMEKHQSYEGDRGIPRLAAVRLDGELSFNEIRSNSITGQIIPTSSHQISAEEILLIQKTRKGMKLGLLSI